MPGASLMMSKDFRVFVLDGRLNDNQPRLELAVRLVEIPPPIRRPSLPVVGNLYQQDKARVEGAFRDEVGIRPAEGQFAVQPPAEELFPAFLAELHRKVIPVDGFRPLALIPIRGEGIRVGEGGEGRYIPLLRKGDAGKGSASRGELRPGILNRRKGKECLCGIVPRNPRPGLRPGQRKALIRIGRRDGDVARSGEVVGRAADAPVGFEVPFYDQRRVEQIAPRRRSHQ